MKSLVLSTLIASFVLFASCSSNSEEDDPGIDCSQSNLDVEITNSTKPDCDIEGSISVSGSGGTEPYTYSIDGINFQSSATFNGLAASTYSLTIKDADECTRNTSFNLQSGPNGITLSVASKTASSCFGDTGTIEISASGGDGTFSYSLDGGSDQENGSFSSVGSGEHSIKVIDGTGCSATISVSISADVSLVGDIMPILQANCLQTSSGGGGCHNGDNGASRNWTNKNNVLAKASEIKSRTQSGSMPQAGSGQSLTDEEIDLIACWVDDGAKDN
ncbi:MAG: SprB repeat-containing protein [Ekhidna sp.]|uniref:SprB repeat-containing protein n=1 Tax=Ekhidna sp. TaxID=2608089 RepID=UPI0032ECE077